MTTTSVHRKLSLVEILDDLELKLRKNMKGKALLGEIVLSSAQCDNIAGGFRRILERYGPSTGLRSLADRWPLTLAVWLVNEAFFHFARGTYWPYVFARISVADVNNYSSRVGQAFLQILDRFLLPRFRRLRTRWSYLGPILAHCGIPQSCLGELFDKVVPLASELSAWEEAGFEELQHQAPRLYLRRPTEMFLLFGEQIAKDFIHRTVNLSRGWETTGTVPTPESTGLPSRVVEAFRDWVQRAHRPTVARRSFRRPLLYVHDWQGVQLLLPAQSLLPGERMARWIVEPDAGDPTVTDLRPDPGERTVGEKDLTLAEPFSSVMVRLLIDEREAAVWPISGVTEQKPVLFFDPDNGRVLPERSVDARPIGIACPAKWKVLAQSGGTEREAPVIEKHGKLPFGWSELDIRVLDLTDAERLTLLDDKDGRRLNLELAEREAERPRLVAVTGLRQEAADVEAVFIGAAPVLELWRDSRQSMEDFLSSWELEIVPANQSAASLAPVRAALSSLEVEASLSRTWGRVRLDQTRLLGPLCWGEFRLRAHGPMGQDASFHFRVLPELTVSHDWTDDWRGTEPLRVLLGVPAGTRLRGAQATADPLRYEIRMSGGRTRLAVETMGYGGVPWDLPLNVHVPIPTWAVYEPGSKTHLLSWTQSPLRISLTELEGQSPTLLVRLATPWGVPSRACLHLRAADRVLFEEPVSVDNEGRGRVDLTAALAAARQHGAARLRLETEIELRRPVFLHCAEVCREWAPQDFSARIDGNTLAISWHEQILVGSRALRAEPLLVPWEPARVIEIPDTAREHWTVPVGTLMPDTGIYRLCLGRADDWTGRFEAAANAEATVAMGTVDNWACKPEFRDVGPNGYLYRLLLEHHTGIGGNLGVPEIDPETDQRTLAIRLLKARSALENRPGVERLRGQLDRFLALLHVGYVAAAIASTVETFDREALLRSGLLLRPWREAQRAGGDARIPVLSDEDAETMWRLWKPLGMWADLQLWRDNPRAAEARVIHHLGGEQIAALSPVTVGSKVGLWSDALEESLHGGIVEVHDSGGRSPFDLVRVGPGIELKIRVDEPEKFRGCDLCLARGEDGLWTIGMVGEADGGDPFDLPSRLGGRVSFFYRECVAGFGAPLEGPLIGIIRSGNVGILQAIQQYCVLLPTSPISPEAYQQASFAWCHRATSDRTYRGELEDTCRGFVASFGRLIGDTSWPASTSLDWRVYRELRARWLANAFAEPFFAVPALSWAAAFGLIWRSLAKTAPILLRENELLQLGLAANQLLPELFEHDLLKVGALQALDRAYTAPTWRAHES